MRCPVEPAPLPAGCAAMVAGPGGTDVTSGGAVIRVG
jgi:hypothetical protein